MLASAHSHVKFCSNGYITVQQSCANR